MTTAITLIAIILGSSSVFVAWIAGRQHQDLLKRLRGTNERIHSLREEFRVEQQKIEFEKRRLKTELAQLEESGHTPPADPEATGPLTKAQLAPPRINEISPQRLKSRLDRGDNFIIVDMRQPFEYNSGHIPGAINMFIEHIPSRAQELPQDKEIIFQCWTGYTSLQASAYLIDQGWSSERIASLSGGIAAWTQVHGMDSLERN